MQIEIAEPSRMTQTGSSLIRLIQNNDMPVLDLLIRESIQNSLDARIKTSSYIDVNFMTGFFNSEKLGNELDQLTNSLFNRYGNTQKEYIAIRDSHTVGLTGVMDYRKVQGNDYGNLLKLVYEICKPQEDEGAGGSWGIGKTVYFRIGIGLVIYYSRIQNENGEYESRLAASLVENESDSNAMIPTYKGMSKRGIAWWGDEIEENITQPVTDEEYINKVLNIFSLSPYEQDETGTTIIIPYIDRDELLSNNSIEYLNGQDMQILIPWKNSIEDYLTMSVQRWYSPRLNNVNYQQGAYLRFFINNRPLTYDSMEPIFKVIQSLYNRANFIEIEDDILLGNEDTYVEKIRLRKYIDDQTIGVLAFTKVNKAILGMNPPTNKPEPFMYFNNEIRDTDINRPTVCYTRKPAMIVSYENVGPWVSNIPSSSKDEYILGIFVLNSFNRIVGDTTTKNVEEYIRKSEMADHTSWSDWSEKKFNPRFVTKIQTNTNKIISRKFETYKEIEQPKINSGLGKLYGDLLLPPEGFGNLSSRSDFVSTRKNISSPRFKFGIDNLNIKYSSTEMKVPIIMETSNKKRISHIGFDVFIDSESKRISLDDWENKMGLKTPFEIKKFKVLLNKIDGEKVVKEECFEVGDQLNLAGMEFETKISKRGTCHGLNIVSNEKHYFSMKIFVYIDLNRNDLKPVFVCDKEGV